ncbi:hypothetical protein CR513_13441, partial [Mucuna pruriens]
MGRKQKRSGIDSLPLAYLEERMSPLGRLTIYNIILLPYLDEYVDLVAIDVFLANQEQRRNPVMAILVDTYYTIQRYHERKGGRLICYLQTLYLWLVTHTCPCRCVTTHPIEDLKWCWGKNGHTSFENSLIKSFAGILNGTSGR